MRPDIQHKPVKQTMRVKRGKGNFIRRFGDLLAQRDGGWNCHYCGIPLVRGRRKAHIIEGLRQRGLGLATVDHVVPLSKGGSNKPENMLLACFICNERKGESSYSSFIRYLEYEHVLKNQNCQNQLFAKRG